MVLEEVGEESAPSSGPCTEFGVYLGMNIEETALLYLMGSLKFYSYIQDRKIVFQRTVSARSPALISYLYLCVFHVFLLFIKGRTCRTIWVPASDAAASFQCGFRKGVLLSVCLIF